AGTVACGNCGAAVTTGDVTCPACGVLLAAYQAPDGSLGGDTPAANAAPSYAPPPPVPDAFSVPPSPDRTVSPPPVSNAPTASSRRPVANSPMDDALRRVRDEDVETAALETSAARADELATMAADNSTLAQEVEAELAGARVTFDGGTPAIVTSPTPATPSAVPEVETTATAAALDSPSAPPATPRTRPQRTPVPQPSASPSRGPAPQVRPQSSRPISWLPIIVIVVVFLVVGRALSSVGSLMALIFGIIAVIVLLRMAATMTGRKTTAMPWEDSSRKTRRK
ncbi:MAG TPA: hypothetical protein VD767_08450, partial [Thermomicrobiales bacterium]|nr:hypothetical protein [Thermomicrobiales bacterium]